MIDLAIVDHILGEQPGHEVVSILDCRNSEAEVVPDLGTMILDGAATPIVLQILLGWHAELRRDIRDDGRRHLVLVLREASLHLEILEQERAAEAIVAR